MAGSLARTTNRGHTVERLLHEWLEHAGPSLSPRTVLVTRGYIDSTICPVLGTIPVAKLTTQEIDRFYRRLLTVGGPRVKYTRATIRRVHGILRRALSQGITVVGGSLTAAGYYSTPPAGGNGSSCANFDGPDVVGEITVVIHWATNGGPIAATTVRYKLNTFTVAGSPTDTITLKAPTGNAVKAGSFVTPVPPNKTEVATNLPAPVGCTTTPVTAFTISGGSVHM